MRSIAGTKRIAIAAVAILAAAVLAYVGYGVYQKRTLRAQVAQTVDAASVRLAASLGTDIAAPTAAIVERLDRDTEQTDAELQRLRAAPARPDRALVEAADGYVANALAVLRRQAGSTRGRLRFADSRQALADHMAQASRRDASWSSQAIKLRERLDGDYFEFRIASTSLGNALNDLPGTQRAIAALLPGARLAEEAAIKEAQARTLAAANAIRLEYEQAKQLPPR
jgi:hypothetical protein